MLLSFWYQFTPAEWACLIIAGICVVAVVLGFIVLAEFDKTLHQYDSEVRENVRQNSLEIGRLSKRIHYIEEKLFHPTKS